MSLLANAIDVCKKTEEIIKLNENERNKKNNVYNIHTSFVNCISSIQKESSKGNFKTYCDLSDHHLQLIKEANYIVDKNPYYDDPRIIDPGPPEKKYTVSWKLNNCCNKYKNLVNLF